jgi:hypothetical protein
MFVMLMDYRASTQWTVAILGATFLTVGKFTIHLMTIQMTVRHQVFVLSVLLIRTGGRQM